MHDMQILRRRSGESLYIDLSESADPSTPVGALFADGPIEIEVVRGGKHVKLGIDAPRALARVLEVGNQVDLEPGSLFRQIGERLGRDRVTVGLAGAVAMVVVSALSWWMVPERAPHGDPFTASLQLATREVPVPASRIPVSQEKEAAAAIPDVTLPPRSSATLESPLKQIATMWLPAPRGTLSVREHETMNYGARESLRMGSRGDPAGNSKPPLSSKPASREIADATPDPDKAPAAKVGEGQLRRNGAPPTEGSEVGEQRLGAKQQVRVAQPERLPAASRAAPATDAMVHREAWLLSQPPERYTLQLFGVRQESAVLRFLGAHQLDGPLAYYKTQYRGKDWFVLLFGDYPSASSARQAFMHLPRAARLDEPYARSMASVQASINAATVQR
jgi:septal ring-binding cell division protein DamX